MSRRRQGAGGIPVAAPSAVRIGSRDRLVAVIVALFALAANLPALFAGFIQDDHPIVENNRLLESPAGLPDLLARAYWAVGDRPLPDLYRPLTMLSFALNRALTGAGAAGYRLVNLLLHAGIAVLVFLLARRLFGPARGRIIGPAAAAGLLFAVHAVHTEVLGFVVGRAELLAAGGTLLCVLLFLRGRGPEAAGRTPAAPAARAGLWYGLSIACFALGFLSKENAIVAPALALVADLVLSRRPPAWGYHAASASAAGALLGLRRLAIGSLGSEDLVHFLDNPIVTMPFVPARQTALAVVGRYARLLVAPFGQSIDYSYDAIPRASGWLDPGVLTGTAIAAAAAAALALAWRRRPAAAFALAWLGGAFLPVANLLFPIGTIMAERLLYLPSVGFCLLVATGYGAMLRTPPAAGDASPGAPAARRPSRVAPAALLVVVAILAARSQIRLRDWRDDYTIFRSALGVAPRSVKVQFNFGSACEERGEEDEAIAAYGRALAIWPAFADAHYNLAGILARRGEWAGAVGHYREAIREQPGNVKYLVNMAHALNGAGDPGGARDLLQRAIAIDPSSDQAYTTLGAAELLRGDAAAAERAYAEAVRLVPGNPGYWTNLGLARGKTGNAGGAVEALRRAVALVPGNPVYRNQLGRHLEAAGRVQEAAAEYRTAIELAPGVPVPRRNLGLLLYRAGDRRGALAALESAAALDPKREVMDREAWRALEDLRR